MLIVFCLSNLLQRSESPTFARVGSRQSGEEEEPLVIRDMESEEDSDSEEDNTSRDTSVTVIV